VHNSLELFRNSVKAELDRRKWSASRLAEGADLYPSQVSRYLSGHKDPSLPVVDRIAAALDKDAWELIKPAGADAEKALHAVAKLAGEVAQLPADRAEILAALPSLQDAQVKAILRIIRHGGQPVAKILEDANHSGKKR
jgi:transcriptional regulator with XRE-family HTH domain